VPNPATALDDHVSPTEAARILGISRDHLCDLARSGAVPVTEAPGGRRFYPRAAVEELRRVRSERPAVRRGRPTIGERAERPRAIATKRRLRK
jgi:hypothetical protein